MSALAELSDIETEQLLVGEPLPNQPSVVEVDERVEDGAGEWPRPVMDLIRDLRHLSGVAGEPDLPVAGELGDAVQFVQDEQIGLAMAQKPVHPTVEMQKRQQRDQVGAGFMQRPEIRVSQPSRRKAEKREENGVPHLMRDDVEVERVGMAEPVRAGLPPEFEIAISRLGVLPVHIGDDLEPLIGI